MFSIIVATGKNFEIGQNNQLLYHLSDDLKRFKQITSGHTVLMGENTYLSLPVKPLPCRRNIVLTFNKSATYQGCEMAYSINEAIALCPAGEEVFIMGGASIYRQFFPLCNKLYITFMDAEFPHADVFFPEINYQEWNLTEEIFHPANDKHIYNFYYRTYVRKKKIDL